jgi:hypothetical protein
MKYWISLLFILLLSSCANLSSDQTNDVGNPKEQTKSEATPQKISVNLKNYGPAPELENEVWLNTDGPLRLANLRGKVVLLDMWTFG